MNLPETMSQLFGAPEPDRWADHLIERVVKRALSDEWVMEQMVRAVVFALKPPADTDPTPESQYLVPPEFEAGDYVKLFGANPMDAFRITYITEDRKALVAISYFREELFELNRISQFIMRKADK